MPEGAQNLYFHMGLLADDDGFVGDPRRILKMLNANEDNLGILIAKAAGQTLRSAPLSYAVKITNK